MVVSTFLDNRNPELGYLLPMYVTFTFTVTMVATTVSDYRDAEWGCFIWNHILDAVYVRFSSVVMVVVTAVLDYRNPKCDLQSHSCCVREVYRCGHGGGRAVQSE